MHRPARLALAVRLLASLVLVAGCAQPAASGGAPSPTAPTPSLGAAATVHGTAVAGPTCPVEPAPPASGQCAARPVAGAVLVITDAAEHEVTRLTTGADGTFSVPLPPGSYTLTPQRVEGLMGVAPPLTFSILGASGPEPLTVEYDTGIR